MCLPYLPLRPLKKHICFFLFWFNIKLLIDTCALVDTHLCYLLWIVYFQTSDGLLISLNAKTHLKGKFVLRAWHLRSLWSPDPSRSIPIIWEFSAFSWLFCPIKGKISFRILCSLNMRLTLKSFRIEHRVLLVDGDSLGNISPARINLFPFQEQVWNELELFELLFFSSLVFQFFLNSSVFTGKQEKKF